MMRIKIVAFLLCLFPFVARCELAAVEKLRSSAAQFPKIEFGKDENGFARVHLLTPAKSVEIDGWYYHGFRFTTPEWLDQSVLWMFLHPEQDNEKVGRFRWSIVPVEGDADFQLTYLKKPARAFKSVNERFPHAREFLVQSFPKDDLEPGKEYLVCFCYQQPQIPKLALAMTVKSDRGIAEFGSIPTGKPDPEKKSLPKDAPRLDPKPQVAKVVEAYRKGGREAGLRALDEITPAFEKEGGVFRPYFNEVWREAQTRTGREDPEWAADVWDWLFRAALARGDRELARSVTSNALGGLAVVRRFGRAKEIRAWQEENLWRSGFELDPRTYPDLGPGLAALPEIRRREVPKGPPFGTPTIRRTGEFSMEENFDRMNASAFLSLAGDREQAGHWQEAMEWRVWAQIWSEAVTEASKDKKPIGEVSNIWYEAVGDNADNLLLLGLTEAARDEYQRVIDTSWPDSYQGRGKLQAKLDRIACSLDLGEFDPSLVNEAAELAQKAKSNGFLTKPTWQRATLIHARCLLASGNKAEGSRMLDELVADGCEPARQERCVLRLAAGTLDGVEEDLKLLLAYHRAAGKKISEAQVYSLYAEFLEASGRLDEALAMRRESIRLMRSFDLFALLPAEQARLSCLLAKCGDRSSSDAAAAEATRLSENEKRIPARIRSSVKSLLASRSQGDAIAKKPADKKGTVDLQPLRSLVIPVVGRPLRGRLTLSNPNTIPVEGTLAFDGIPADATWDVTSGEARVTLGTAGVDRLMKVRIEPGSFAVIRLAAAAGAIGKGTLSTVWSAPGQKDQISELKIDDAEAGVSSAVVEAGEYRGNPFYSVPIHHHFVRADSSDAPADFRITASAPARVEMYDEEDQPVFVDVRGDGSLTGTSDVLYADRNSDGAGDVTSKEGEASFRLQVYPDGVIAPEGLTLKIESKVDGAWVAVSEDRIMP
ncbi:hypothetical protein [Luteolibacter soli]|uniref:Tetratricopeptide repeat protein n=1 Tax=Luteolibacter soli TaxID=3135280 RepID=A0ABU9AYT7_9BACT